MNPHRPYETRRGYDGFSWTTFFWGFWPAVFRADWAGAAAGLGVFVGPQIASFLLAFFGYSLDYAGDPYAVATPIGDGLWMLSAIAALGVWIWWSYFYNGWHTRRLRSQGWIPAPSTMPASFTPQVSRGAS